MGLSGQRTTQGCLTHNCEDQLYGWALRLPVALPHPDSWWPVGNTVGLLDGLFASFPEASDSCFRGKVIVNFEMAKSVPVFTVDG